jgi:hypothetical protein
MCAKCDNEPEIREILSAADGEIGLNMYCPHCEIELYYLTTGQKLILKALLNDLKENKEVKKPIKPPLKKKEDHKVEDHNFLKDLGIDDEEK